MNKKVFSYIGWTFFAMMAITQILQAIIAIVLGNTFPQALSQPWSIFMLVAVSFYLTTFPMYLAMMKKLPTYPATETKSLSLKEFIKLFIISIAATYIFNFVSIFINLILAFIKGGDILNPLGAALQNSSLIYIFLFTVIFAPIVEEIIFRGVLIDKLRCYGDKVCIFVSAFTFALYHGNLSQILYAFVLGAIFAYVVLKFGTIKYSILLHMSVNFCGSVLFPFIVSLENELLTQIIGLFVILMIIIGTVLFFKDKKNIVLNDSDIDRSELSIFKNSGMIAYIILSILMIILVILS